MTGDSTRNHRSIKLAAIAVTVVALTAYVGYAFYDMNGHSLDFRNREIRIIITDSMDGDPQPYSVPTIEKDSLVMVVKISEEDKEMLQPGDVVQFHYGKILNHHRVISNDIESKEIVTKGDNTTSTETVKYSDIRGEVVGKNHFLGEVFKFVKQYFLVIIALLVVLYIGNLLLEEIRRGKKEEKQ